MASSNRHWPSMFKSKPCNSSHHHQWQQPDINPSSLVSSGNCNLNPYSSGPGTEERTPEPKPRWNPRPEQIRILEAIFNSGMVNPPRDEIRKIRAQLQEYGQVGDANVFYWFQNRKSRSKHKQRQLQNAAKSHQAAKTLPVVTTAAPSNAATSAGFITAPSPSSSSSDKSSPNNSNEKSLSVGPATVIDLLNSPTASVNQPFLQAPTEFLPEPFFLQHAGGSNTSASLTQGFCFPNVSSGTVDNCPNSLLSELMLMSNLPSKDEFETMKQHTLSFTTNTATVPQYHYSFPTLNNQILQAVGEAAVAKSTVFINDVCFEVGPGPFNVREAFGDDAVLVQSSSGQPVLTNEWGVTLQPLQHGGFYYLFRPFTPSPVTFCPHDRTIDLI